MLYHHRPLNHGNALCQFYKLLFVDRLIETVNKKNHPDNLNVTASGDTTGLNRNKTGQDVSMAD